MPGRDVAGWPDQVGEFRVSGCLLVWLVKRDWASGGLMAIGSLTSLLLLPFWCKCLVSCRNDRQNDGDNNSCWDARWTGMMMTLLAVLWVLCLFFFMCFKTIMDVIVLVFGPLRELKVMGQLPFFFFLLYVSYFSFVSLIQLFISYCLAYFLSFIFIYFSHFS